MEVEDFPDRYIEGDCPECGIEVEVTSVMSAEQHMKQAELRNPKSKMNPEFKIEIKKQSIYSTDLIYSRMLSKDTMI